MDSAKKTSQISVVIPVYNGARFLRDAIRSVLSQAVLPAELVILDNASTDGTGQVIDEFRDHPLLRSYRNDTTLPPITNWQKAVSFSTAPYFTILPADDLLGPDLLATAWRTLQEHPQVGFFFCLGQDYIDENGAKIGDYLHIEADLRGVIPQRTFLERLLRGQFFMVQGAVIKRAWFDSIGGFDPAIIHHGDYEMYVRLASLGDVYAYPGTLATDRHHADQGRARCYYTDDGDGDRIFHKIASYAFLSEGQREILVHYLCDHYFQLFTRRLRDSRASLQDIAEQRRRTFEIIDSWRRDSVPWARYARRLPSRWRARVVWTLTASSSATRMVQILARHLPGTGKQPGA